MRRTFVIEPHAEIEIVSAGVWLSEQITNGYIDFLVAVDRVFQLIQEHPELYQVLYENVRKAPLLRFPYVILYALWPDQIAIIGCVHTSRDPKLWRDRTR